MNGLTRDGMISGLGQNTFPPVVRCEHSVLFIINGNKLNAFKLYMLFYTGKESILMINGLNVT
jgi:hypothetical protein